MLSAVTRKIRIINTLTSQEQSIEVKVAILTFVVCGLFLWRTLEFEKKTGIGSRIAKEEERKKWKRSCNIACFAEDAYKYNNVRAKYSTKGCLIKKNL